MKTKAFPLAAAALIVLLITGMPIAAGASRLESSTESLEECVARNGRIAVLMLIDESKSLKEVKVGGATKLGNDPDDSRVPALESVVRILSTSVESSKSLKASGGRPLEVAVGISGFGDGYTERLKFENLTEQTLRSITDALEVQREKDSDLHTRYHTALAGALKTFDSYSTSPEVCRLLVWFSDGEHDDDNAPGFVPTERDQIQKQICGSDGIVDRLRGGAVNIVAAGLNADDEKLGLMRLISEGGSGYSVKDQTGREGRVGVSVDRCGDTEPNGKYALATDADQIVDKLFEVLATLPGIPIQKNELEIPKAVGSACTDSSGQCNTIEFEVDANISSFQILAERPSKDVEVVLTTNQGQVYAVLNRGELTLEGREGLEKNSVKTRPVTERKVLISVVRRKENSIDGPWKIDFLGDGAAQSRGTVNFVGTADVEIRVNGTRVNGEQISLGRFDAASLGVKVASSTSGSEIRGVRMELGGFEGVVALSPLRDEFDPSLFTVSKTEVERALSSASLRKASSADLVVVPLGDVKGLRFKDGTPVPVNFGSRRFGVRVSNGSDLPSFVRVDGPALFKGTPKAKVNLVFLGPDSGDGTVSFLDAVEEGDATANLDLIGRDPCVIKQQTEVACPIELIPDKATWDRFNVAIGVTYSSVTSPDEVTGEVVVNVTMEKKPSVGKGLLAALELLAIFLVIQGLVRLLLAYLLSKFAPLVATARRIRLDAIVDANGALTVNPILTNPTQNDEGFALENTQSVQSFNIFGYQFEVSVLNTFLRSTVAPLGLVTAPSTYVFGSRGYSRPKSAVDSSTGKVSLTLRGQWIIGIRFADLQRLVNGEGSVPAEVVAFLEPYEQGADRDQQVSDLSFGLSASGFASQFVEVLAEERDRFGMQSPATGGATSAPIDTNDPFGGMTTIENDPFGGSIVTPEDDQQKSGRRKQRSRKTKKMDESGHEIPNQHPSQPESLDPFA